MHVPHMNFKIRKYLKRKNTEREKDRERERYMQREQNEREKGGGNNKEIKSKGSQKSPLPQNMIVTHLYNHIQSGMIAHR